MEQHEVAIKLSPWERTLMESQCRVCKFWDNFYGCKPPGGSEVGKPVEGCPAFEPIDDERGTHGTEYGGV